MKRFKKWKKDVIDRKNHLSWGPDDLEISSLAYEPNVDEDSQGFSGPHDFANPKVHSKGIENDTHGDNSGSILGPRDNLSMSEHASTFNAHHIESIEQYKMQSKIINDPFRTGINRPQHNELMDHSEHQFHVKNLDHVTSHRMPNDHVTFRGVDDRWHEAEKLKPGDHIFDRGYTGTSHVPSVASDFAAASATGHKPIFRIHMPAGTKAYHLDRHESGHEHEQETLLHRGTKFRVGDHHRYDKHHVIDLHVVSQGHDKI